MTYFKKIVFTFIAVVLIPLLFFLLLELSLKGFSVGTSFNYFNEIDIEGQLHFQDNPKFTHQFYPPSLNINPIHNTFTEERDPGLIRIYILGGSAALGFPQVNHGFDRHLETQLRAALPSRKIEIINTAMTSVNSHVVYEVAKGIPKGSADFAIILMGNNEVVGPYGPGTFNQNFLSNLTMIRGLQTLKRSRSWQALSSIIQQVKPTDAKQELIWKGMEMFTKHNVTQVDPRLESVYSHYENNLRDIIDILHDKGTHVILSSVPVNLRHSAPFSSVHNSDLSKQQLGKWEEINDKGSQSFEQKNWNGAITSFQAALEIDADYADTHFRLATAYENLKQFEKAKTHYERSLDLDTLRFRADTNINQVIQNVAASIEYDAFDFVDSLAAFEQVSKPFQPGWNLLYEHVHYDFLGNHILATELSRSILSNVTASDNYQPLSSVEVAKRIGYPNKESVDVMKPLLKMVQSPPFTGQSNASELKAFIAEKKARVTKEVGSPTEVIQRRKEIIDSGAADWKIHFEMAGLYWKLHNRRAVYHHLNEVFRLYPHNRKSRMRMIDIMSKDGKFSEVIPHIEQSFYYSRGDEKKIAQSIGLLGMAYFKIGEYEKATETLLEMPEKYSDQIGLTLKAYGTLVKYSREEGKAKDLNRYIRDVRQYARTLMREGKDQEYPLLYKRMSQIMLLAGHEKEAKKWKTTQPSSK